MHILAVNPQSMVTQARFKKAEAEPEFNLTLGKCWAQNS